MPRSVMSAGDEPRRRHVEGRSWRRGCRRAITHRRDRAVGGAPGHMRDLVGAALLDRDFAHAVRDRPVDGRATAARHRTARRCPAPPAPSDRCRSCWRRRRCAVTRSVPTMHEIDPAVLHQMAAGIVGDDGVRHAVLAEFPGGQRRALVARARLVHPDVDAACPRHAPRRSAPARCPNRPRRASRRCNG